MNNADICIHFNGILNEVCDAYQPYNTDKLELSACNGAKKCLHYKSKRIFLNQIICSLTHDDLRLLRSIINGKLSRRILTTEDAKKMADIKKAKRGLNGNL